MLSSFRDGAFLACAVMNDHFVFQQGRNQAASWLLPSVRISETAIFTLSRMPSGSFGSCRCGSEMLWIVHFLSVRRRFGGKSSGKAISETVSGTDSVALSGCHSVLPAAA